VRILTDPFDEQVGYKLPDAEADIVTTSHDHYDHNNTGIVKGNYTHISGPGIFSEHGIHIKGVATFHDADNGARRGKNTVFKFDVDGIKVCHCGDLGHVLTSEQVKEIGEVDVLLVPVGGVYTVNYKGAAEVAEILKPSVIIPMHYKTEALSFHLESIDGFLHAMGITGERPGQELELEKGSLPEHPSVLVFDYK